MKFASTLIATVTLLLCSQLAFAGQAGGAQVTYLAASSLSMADSSPKKGANKLKVTSSQQAIQIVKRQYRDKVLKVQSTRINGHPGYRIKLLSPKGVVFYVSVDAQTGRVIRN